MPEVQNIKGNTFLFSFLKEMIIHRLNTEYDIAETALPELEIEKTDYENCLLLEFIRDKQLSAAEVTILLLAVVPHLSPNFLTSIISDLFPNGGEFPEFGGAKGKNHRGILPTGETALYVLAGNDLDLRLEYVELISTKSALFKKGILYLEEVPIGEPKMSGKLLMDEEYVAKLTTGTVLKPQLGPNFPASLIETSLEWEDLVLKPKTLEEIKEVEIWLQYNAVLMEDWKMKNKIKPGFRVMFYGPPGTGKTLTASLLGKYTGMDVYRIDLSMVISKYIGETEKNLSGLFNKAANKDWILFFDEADAVFGKRTNVRDAHDKYANQEVSYLLQRIESHPGLVILASNFKSNMDSAFTRRFQSMIAFDTPTFKERIKLWENNLPKIIPLESAVSLKELSKTHAITGANIVNVIQYACLKTIAGKHQVIREQFILEGIKKEYQKEGKTLN